MYNSTDVFALDNLLKILNKSAPPTPDTTAPSRPFLMNISASLTELHGQLPSLETSNPRLQILVVKSVCLTVLWISAFTLACLPLCVSKFLSRALWWKDREKPILGALNYGSGGVFLATIFLELLPDLEESYDKAFKSNGIEFHYPFSELTVVCGMLLFVFFEQIIINVSQRCLGGDDVMGQVLDHEGHSHSITCGNHSHMAKCSHKDAYHGDDDDEESAERLLCSDDTDMGASNKTRLIKTYDIDRHEGQIVNEDNPYQSSTEILGRTPPRPRKQESRDVTSPRTFTILRNMSLMLALSLHSVFEGLVLGFQTEESIVWKLFFALIVHKSLVAFSLGSKFATIINMVRMRSIVMMALVFSLAAPLGGVVSTAIGQGYQTDDSPVFQLVVSLINGVASGSFLFVTFFEILKGDGGPVGFVNACFMTLGFTMAALL